MIFSALTQHAIQAALQGAAVLKKGFGTTFEWSFKEGDHNLVTFYDKESEKVIVKYLRSFYPHHSFLLEESGFLQGDIQDILWIIDPLDGTVNFAHNIPFFSISIAAMNPEGDLLLGVVLNPMSEELFVAEKNLGAFLNGQPICVSSNSLLSKSFLATGFPYNVKENPLSCIEHFSEFAKMGVPIRRLGSAALDLCYTACGRFDGFFEVSLQPWDFSAGALIVQEAQGVITNYQNLSLNFKKASPVVASNKKLHSALLNVLQKRYN